MRRLAPGELAFAVAIVALGVFFLVETSAIKVTPVYARVGPRFFPLLVGAALVLVGAALGWQAVRGGWRDRAALAAQGPTDWAALLLISAGVVQQIFLIRPLGFIVSSTLLFVLVAVGFRSRRYLLTAVLGLLVSAAVYIAFTRGLDLALPAGALWDLG